MIVSSRLAKILEICLAKDNYVTVEELSSSLQISTRTVFREIRDIDYCLKPYQLTISSKSGKGIKIVGSSKDKEALYQEMIHQGVTYVNKEERRNLLIFEILRSREVQKLYHYANLFSVSEGTVSNDLDHIESWFKNYNLNIIRTPGLGIELSGDESDYRRAMTDILQESIQSNPAYHNVNRYDSSALLHQIFMNQGVGIMKLLNQEILERVLDVFQLYNHELNLDRYAQSSYIGLIIHLTIAIDRILKKEAITDHQSVFEIIKNDASFKLAEKMASLLEKEFEITMPRMEIAFIAMHIKGAKLTSAKVYDATQEIESYKEEELTQLIFDMIDVLDAPYLKNDEQLINGLIAHLRPTIIRLKYELPIFNPLLKELQSLYKPIFDKTKEACQLLTHLYNCEVVDDEIGYITMHFGAAIERYQQVLPTLRDINVGIVCSSGIGVSALLLARIKKIVDEHVHLITLGIEEVYQNQMNCELLISTFDFESTINKITVNPLLMKQDVEHILNEIERQRRKQSNYLPTNIHFVDVPSLIKSIKHLYENFTIHKVSADYDQNQLFEAIANQINEKQRDVIVRDLRKRESINTSIFHNFGFALFHAKSDAVDHLVFQVYLRDNSEEVNEVFKDIRFVICMLIPSIASRWEKEIMSRLSRSIIEYDDLNHALHEADERLIKEQVLIVFKDILFDLVIKGEE